MHAVGSGGGGGSTQATSKRVQHGVIAKDVPRHERANTRAPKESKKISAVERAMNSHKLEKSTGGSPHERANTREVSKAKSVSAKERAMNDHRLDKSTGGSAHERANTREVSKAKSISAKERAMNSHRIDSGSSSKANEKSVKSESMKMAKENAGSSIADQSASIVATVAASSNNVYLKAAGTIIGAKIDTDTVRTSKSDFKKGLSVASMAGSIAGPASAVISVFGNAVYDKSTKEQQKALDKFAAGPKDSYSNGLNKVNASKVMTKKGQNSSKATRNSNTKRYNVANHKSIPKVTKAKSRTKNLGSKRLSASEQRASNVAKYKAKKRREAARKSRRSKNRSNKKNRSSRSRRSRRRSAERRRSRRRRSRRRRSRRRRSRRSRRRR